jgi:uncharacterized membrane protein HdeD (DUF308 family)
MANANVSRPGEPVRHELEAFRSQWWWLLLLGALLIISGMIAVSSPWMATNVIVTIIGLLLVICGGAQIVGSFWTGKWSGFLLSLLAGVLYVCVGGLMVARPLVATVALTMLIGAFLLVGGIFRAVSAMALKFHNWGWLLLNGVISIVLGLMILSHLDWDALVVIGLFVGIDMIFNGWAWVMLSLGLRSLPKEA